MPCFIISCPVTELEPVVDLHDPKVVSRLIMVLLGPANWFTTVLMGLIYLGKLWENRRKTIGKPWENGGFMGYEWDMLMYLGKLQQIH